MTTVETSASKQIDSDVADYQQKIATEHGHLPEGTRLQMAADYKRALIDALPSVKALDARIAANKAAAAQEQRDRERLEFAALDEARAASEAALKEQTWGTFGGTRAAFEAGWPALRDRILAEQTAAAVSERQAGFRRQIQGRW